MDDHIRFFRGCALACLVTLACVGAALVIAWAVAR